MAEYLDRRERRYQAPPGRRDRVARSQASRPLSLASHSPGEVDDCDSLLSCNYLLRVKWGILNENSDTGGVYCGIPRGMWFEWFEFQPQ